MATYDQVIGIWSITRRSRRRTFFRHTKSRYQTGTGQEQRGRHSRRGLRGTRYPGIKCTIQPSMTAILNLNKQLSSILLLLVVVYLLSYRLNSRQMISRLDTSGGECQDRM